MLYYTKTLWTMQCFQLCGNGFQFNTTVRVATSKNLKDSLMSLLWKNLACLHTLTPWSIFGKNWNGTGIQNVVESLLRRGTKSILNDLTTLVWKSIGQRPSYLHVKGIWECSFRRRGSQSGCSCLSDITDVGKVSVGACGAVWLLSNIIWQNRL